MSAEKFMPSGDSKSEQSDVIERLVSIRRVAKVVKGGRRFSFSSLVIAGNGKGMVGFGTGGGVEVMDARKKATDSAKKKMIRVPLREGRTLHHDVIGKFGSATVVLRSAPQGTGIIAGGALRAVFECLGVHDVVVKSIGTSNPHNMVKACFNAFENIHSPKQIAERRGKKISDIIGRRESNTAKGKENDSQESN